MKRLLVVLHVYYPDQIGYFVRKLRNINGCDWELVVTYVADSAPLRRLRHLKPDARFIKVGNIGYDVWPFIKVIKETDLSAYDYVLKLHTKGSGDRERINGLNMRNYRWRDLLVNALLKNPGRFRKCLDYFDAYPDVGMICCYELRKDLHGGLLENTAMLEEEAKRIGILRNFSDDRFCAGTMFMVRADALGRIQRLQLDDSMWGQHFASHSRSSLAHVYERLMGIMVKDAGYEVHGFVSGRFSAFCVFVHNTLGMALRSLFCIERDEYHRKFVMICGKKFYMGDDKGKV